MNTLIRQRRGDGTEFENVVDADPDDVQTEYDRIDGHGIMIIRDRRSDEPHRTTGNNWTVYTSSLVGFEPTERPAGPLPGSMIEAELRSAGRTYIESRGANGAELAALAREAITAGLPIDAVALVTELPADDIRRLLGA